MSIVPKTLWLQTLRGASLDLAGEGRDSHETSSRWFFFCRVSRSAAPFSTSGTRSFAGSALRTSRIVGPRPAASPVSASAFAAALPLRLSPLAPAAVPAASGLAQLTAALASLSARPRRAGCARRATGGSSSSEPTRRARRRFRFALHFCAVPTVRAAGSGRRLRARRDPRRSYFSSWSCTVSGRTRTIGSPSIRAVCDVSLHTHSALSVSHRRALGAMHAEDSPVRST